MNWRETWQTARELISGDYRANTRIARLEADLRVTREERDELQERVDYLTADLERERAARRIVDTALEQALRIKREEQMDD